jgi:hypothetical protein
MDLAVGPKASIHGRAIFRRYSVWRSAILPTARQEVQD